ncbi:hypothetical protein [Dapis sp. BLCC M229]|uniref:hypothetical protein n=1 Tax=Dapis sp. BLCC M229 TaxID=3400188 RepID=UPI003CED9732
MQRANLQTVTLYDSVQSLSEIWPLAAQHFGKTTALHDPHVKPVERSGGEKSQCQVSKC